MEATHRDEQALAPLALTPMNKTMIYSIARYS